MEKYGDRFTWLIKAYLSEYSDVQKTEGGVAQLELLLLYMEQIVLAVQQIAKNPKKKLESFRREVPLYQSSQIDEQSIIGLVHHLDKFIKVNKVPHSLDRLAASTKSLLINLVRIQQKLFNP